jgi:hypothetical protein
MELKTKNSVSWNTTPCSKLKPHRRFGETYHLNLQGQAKNQQGTLVYFYQTTPKIDDRVQLQ